MNKKKLQNLPWYVASVFGSGFLTMLIVFGLSMGFSVFAGIYGASVADAGTNNLGRAVISVIITFLAGEFFVAAGLAYYAFKKKAFGVAIGIIAGFSLGIWAFISEMFNVA